MTPIRVSYWASFLQNICNFSIIIFVTWLFLESKFASHFVELGWSEAIFKRTAVRHLEFSKFGILVTWLCLSMILLPRTKFRVNRTISRRNVAENDFQYGGRLLHWICFGIIILHSSTLFYVPNTMLNFQLDWFSTLWYIGLSRISILAWNCWDKAKFIGGKYELNFNFAF